MSRSYHILFDGPPGNLGGRFIEVNDDYGRSINAGEWNELEDGIWELIVPKAARPGPEPTVESITADLNKAWRHLPAPLSFTRRLPDLLAPAVLEIVRKYR